MPPNEIDIVVVYSSRWSCSDFNFFSASGELGNCTYVSISIQSLKVWVKYVNFKSLFTFQKFWSWNTSVQHFTLCRGRKLRIRGRIWTTGRTQIWTLKQRTFWYSCCWHSYTLASQNWRRWVLQMTFFAANKDDLKYMVLRM